ncbi:hypothetical protein PSPO01_05104 [Paraphaeosphaeria sporulosa]
MRGVQQREAQICKIGRSEGPTRVRGLRPAGSALAHLHGVSYGRDAEPPADAVRIARVVPRAQGPAQVPAEQPLATRTEALRVRSLADGVPVESQPLAKVHACPCCRFAKWCDRCRHGLKLTERVVPGLAARLAGETMPGDSAAAVQGFSSGNATSVSEPRAAKALCLRRAAGADVMLRLEAAAICMRDGGLAPPGIAPGPRPLRAQREYAGQLSFRQPRLFPLFFAPSDVNGDAKERAAGENPICFPDPGLISMVPASPFSTPDFTPHSQHASGTCHVCHTLVISMRARRCFTVFGTSQAKRVLRRNMPPQHLLALLRTQHPAVLLEFLTPSIENTVQHRAPKGGLGRARGLELCCLHRACPSPRRILFRVRSRLFSAAPPPPPNCACPQTPQNLLFCERIVPFVAPSTLKSAKRVCEVPEFEPQYTTHENYDDELIARPFGLASACRFPNAETILTFWDG